jgi:hypothetical protein
MWFKEDDLMEELEELIKAHQDYEERKERILDNLNTLAGNLRADETIPDNYSYWIEEAIKLIKEGEI